MAGTGPTFEGGQQQVTTVPFNGQESGSTNPLLDAASAQVQYHSQAMTNAAQVLRQTPMYSSESSGQPTMPVPGMKSRLFSGASVHNLDNQQPQTRAGARNKALGQVAAMGAGIVGKWVQKKEAEKTQALAQDLHKTLELTEGLDQAKQVLSDPNSSQQDKQQAQATQQKNQALLTSLLNGKNGKDIAKAYDVTFGPESQKQSPEDKSKSMHDKAMQDALKQRGIDRTQAFQQQMPQKMAVNPAYQNAYKQYQDQEKALSDAQKNYATAYNKDAEFKKDVRVEQYKQENANLREAGRKAAAIQTEQERAATAKYTSRERAGAELESARIRVQGLKDIQKSKNQNDRLKLGTVMANNLSRDITTLQNTNTKLQVKLDSATKNQNKAEMKDLQDQIQDNKAAIESRLADRQDAYAFASGDPQSALAMELMNDIDRQDPNEPE